MGVHMCENKPCEISCKDWKIKMAIHPIWVALVQVLLLEAQAHS